MWDCNHSEYTEKCPHTTTEVRSVRWWYQQMGPIARFGGIHSLYRELLWQVNQKCCWCWLSSGGGMSIFWIIGCQYNWALTILHTRYHSVRHIRLKIKYFHVLEWILLHFLMESWENQKGIRNSSGDFEYSKDFQYL